MLRWTSLLLACCLASAAHAAPPKLPSEEEVARLLAERGLFGQTLDHLEQVGQTVRDKTSDLVDNAMGFLGVPYRRGGNSAATGFDCSGFVRAMFQQTVGLVLPRRANEQAAATDVIDKADLQPGDLVFFNTMRRAFSHVGIYIGDGKFIHSPRTGSQIRVDDLGASYWRQRFNGARRVLDHALPEATLGGSAALQTSTPERR